MNTHTTSNRSAGRTFCLAVLAAFALAGPAASTALAQQGEDEFPANYYFEAPTSAKRAAHRTLEGKPPPPISVSQWIGPSADLASLKGKVVVVDFWATWCGPCMASLPHNVELAAKYEADGLVFVGIHDSQRGWDKAPQTVTKRQIKYPIGKDDGGKSVRAWKLAFWPTYGVIDRTGTLRALGIKPDAVEPVVQKLLAEKAPGKASAGKSGQVPTTWLEGTTSSRRRLDGLLEADIAPPLQVTGWINSDALKLEDLRGKVVLLDFCVSDRDMSTNQMMRNNALYKKHKDAGLTVISICRSDASEKLGEVVSRLGITYPVCVDEAKATATAYRVDGAPDSYIIDRAGRLRVADCRDSSVEEAVKMLLAEEAPKSASAKKQPG